MGEIRGYSVYLLLDGWVGGWVVDFFLSTLRFRGVHIPELREGNLASLGKMFNFFNVARRFSNFISSYDIDISNFQFSNFIILKFSVI